MAISHLFSVSYPRPALLREASRRPVALVGPPCLLPPNSATQCLLARQRSPAKAFEMNLCRYTCIIGCRDVRRGKRGESHTEDPNEVGTGSHV